MKVKDIITETKYVLYLSGKPVSTYENLKDLRGDIYELKKTRPGLNFEVRKEVCRDEPLSDIVRQRIGEQGVAEGPLQEFAPGSGGGDGRWYTDDEIADIIGEEWFDFDLSGEAANISIRGEHAKILLVQEAQAYFEDMGYHGVLVQDVRDDEDYLSWYISGNFTRSGKGVAEDQLNELSPELMRRAVDKYQDKIQRTKDQSEIDSLLDKQARMQGQARRNELGKRYGTTKDQGVAEGMAVNDGLSELWKNHGKAFNLLDYYTNDSGDPKKIQKYKQIIDQLESKCEAEFGSKVCAAMKKHTDAMVDSWYGQSNRSGELRAAKLRKQFGVNWDGQLNETEQGVAEGKKSDRYHIVGKDGKPADLASYPDRASAIKVRDEKYPDAVVQQVGPRGKVKGVAEAGPFSYGKAPRKGSVADLSAKKRKEQEKGKPPIEPKDQMVGVAKVTKGVAEDSKPTKKEYLKQLDQNRKDMEDARKQGTYGVPGSLKNVNWVKKQGVEEGLRDPEDNPCWKGYHPVGTKKKNGRTVPNCVPNPKKKK